MNWFLLSMVFVMWNTKTSVFVFITCSDTVLDINPVAKDTINAWYSMDDSANGSFGPATPSLRPFLAQAVDYTRFLFSPQRVPTDHNICNYLGFRDCTPRLLRARLKMHINRKLKLFF